MRTLRPCPEPGCPTLGPCTAHRRQKERARGSAIQRDYGARHRHWRAIILAKDPICRGCQRRPSTVAEHVIPLNAGGNWAEENGQGCCESCANYKTGRELKDYDFGQRLAASGVPRGWRHMTI
jgi:5-methylcytosine-specific restriction endonuclease McrA